MATGGLAAHRKKVAAGHAHLVLIDESGLLLNPLVRRSWARKGKTPVIGGDGGHRSKVSVIAAVSVSPTANRLGLSFATRPGGSFDTRAVVEFLRLLLAHLRGNVVVVWDGGGNHKGPAVRDLLRLNGRLTLERLPAYSPDLNPVEAVWSWLKYGQLANYVPAGVDELDDEVIDRLVALKFDPGLLRVLWQRSGLPFPKKPDE